MYLVRHSEFHYEWILSLSLCFKQNSFYDSTIFSSFETSNPYNQTETFKLHQIVVKVLLKTLDNCFCCLVNNS